MGPNAFSNWIWHVTDAQIVGDKIKIEAGLRNLTDQYDQLTQAMVLKVEVPFSEFASLEFSDVIEKWSLNEEAYQAYGAQNYQGKNSGDVIANLKFKVKKETRYFPTVTLVASVKTASGADENARFTDSAGYMLNMAFAKDVFEASGAVRKIRILGELGFIAWDDGPSSQNDAYRYGIAANFNFAADTTADLGIHGFTGWRDNGDKPLTLYVEGRKVFSKTLSGFAGADVGLNQSSVPLMVNAGIRVNLDRKYRKRNISQ